MNKRRYREDADFLRPWTQDEIDYALNTILPANSVEQFHGLCDVVGSKLGRSGSAVSRFMWGLASRITHTEYTPGPGRIPRSDKYTYCDIRMTELASKAITKDKNAKAGRSNPQYLAGILGHPVEMVEVLWRKYGWGAGRSRFQLDRYTISNKQVGPMK
jgi:hypothetical protein